MSTLNLRYYGISDTSFEEVSGVMALWGSLPFTMLSFPGIDTICMDNTSSRNIQSKLPRIPQTFANFPLSGIGCTLTPQKDAPCSPKPSTDWQDPRLCGHQDAKTSDYEKVIPHCVVVWANTYSRLGARVETNPGLMGTESILNVLPALCILLGYFIMSSSFVIYVVKEHQTEAERLQHISGAGATFYWATNFIYDMNACIGEQRGWGWAAVVGRRMFSWVYEDEDVHAESQKQLFLKRSAASSQKSSKRAPEIKVKPKDKVSASLHRGQLLESGKVRYGKMQVYRTLIIGILQWLSSSVMRMCGTVVKKSQA
eukprot:gi/632946150/ref/XP_007888415.1/ PREDICTED: ATP-binding cassette sub-family A member 12 [Callorhinchus milii]